MKLGKVCNKSHMVNITRLAATFLAAQMPSGIPISVHRIAQLVTR